MKMPAPDFEELDFMNLEFKGWIVLFHTTAMPLIW